MNYADAMFEIVKDQLVKIMSSDPEYYSKYEIILSNEQQYVKEENRKPKAIYIVIKFMSATITHGQIMLPVNINAIGENNAIEVCQRLLLEYAQEFTLSEEINISAEESGDGSSYIVKQIWQAPQVMSNFNVVYTGFRSLFFMSGTFLLGQNSLPITGITYYDSDSSTAEGTDIEFINASWSFSTQLDSQAFYGTDSRTTSKAKIGTLTLSLAFYLTNNALCKKIRGIAFNNKTDAPNGIKEVFYLSITFADAELDSDGKPIPYVEKMPFHMPDANSLQNIGEFPLITISLTN